MSFCVICFLFQVANAHSFGLGVDMWFPFRDEATDAKNLEHALSIFGQEQFADMRKVVCVNKLDRAKDGIVGLLGLTPDEEVEVEVKVAAAESESESETNSDHSVLNAALLAPFKFASWLYN